MQLSHSEPHAFSMKYRHASRRLPVAGMMLSSPLGNTALLTNGSGGGKTMLLAMAIGPAGAIAVVGEVPEVA
jgi:hypothetical protein